MIELEELRMAAEYSAALGRWSVRANPAAILEMIGEIERLRAALEHIADGTYAPMKVRAIARATLTEPVKEQVT